MIEPNGNLFTRVLKSIGRVIAWPFVRLWRWYAKRGWIAQAAIGVCAIGLIALYGYFVWVTQVWTNFNPDYADAYQIEKRNLSAGEQVEAGATTAARVCGRSAIADVSADLTDFNVNQNAWISSMILYKLGFFGLSWDNTPFLDNKASFQRGINQAVRRTTTELADNLGRLRGTSQVDSDLQSARGNMQFDEYTWYFGLSPFGPKTPTPSFYRSAIKNLRAFNTRLEKCDAVFDARADNLIQFIDRIANDIGGTSAILKDRAESNSAGWLDPRADDRFWFAYGQLYAYYGLLKATHGDFEDVLRTRNLDGLWNQMEQQTRAALNIQPFIISNGAEAGWIMPSHLITMGFYILRVRSNLVEISNALSR
ncbi:hypothetical protein C7441_1202 [Pseudaminobacter salicylatoxidans]|uniref:DUF2333 family protein n=1 Tax=Pseudaminobacter salicylatoxidans TaxID=93369 RepID=A0A316BQ47_PSESE|nr:DUF2333 family protein [Pseudaminobacter salicylatoxidans]PWJ75744.1 hypothetical protein C7441_1202 [Pseudaminobacter salicylatoxidans]